MAHPLDNYTGPFTARKWRNGPRDSGFDILSNDQETQLPPNFGSMAMAKLVARLLNEELERIRGT